MTTSNPTSRSHLTIDIDTISDRPPLACAKAATPSPTAVISAINKDVDDSSVMADAITILLESSEQPSARPFDPANDPCLRIVSICSSSDTTHKYAIPRLLDYYHKRHSQSYPVQAQISHVIPPHRPATMFSVLSEESSRSRSGVPTVPAAHGQLLNVIPRALQRTSSSILQGEEWAQLRSQNIDLEARPQTAPVGRDGDSYFGFKMLATPGPAAGVSGLDPLTYFSGNDPDTHAALANSSAYRSPPLSPEAELGAGSTGGLGKRRHNYGSQVTDENLFEDESNDFSEALLEKYSDNIFHTFCIMPRSGYTKPIVPPFSSHFAINIHPIPSHAIPGFSSFAHSQFTELRYGGAMVICYPTSQKLYSDYVVPCLDRGLHQLLALNLITTSACEEISTLPELAMTPSFEDQKEILQSIPGARIEYSANFEEYKCRDWGFRWFNEEIDWLKAVLERCGLSTSQTLMKLLESMTRSREWQQVGHCDIAVFVVRKLRPEPMASGQ